MIDFYELLDKVREAQKQLREAAEGDREKEKQLAEEEKKTIGAQILHYRKHVEKLTQEELAQKLGVTKMQVIRWEAGGNMPSKLAREKMKEMGILK